MERDLIDAYIAALRDQLGWRPDVEDVVDEVADHLREHSDRFVATGVPGEEAQRRTLECFGGLGLIARSFAQTRSGEIAVPTDETRLAGIAGIGAAIAWTGTAIAGAAGGYADVFAAWTRQRSTVYAILLMTAMALTTLTLAGALQRTGRLRTRTGRTTLGLGLLVTILAMPLNWMISALMVPPAVAVLIACRRREVGVERILRPLQAFGVLWLPCVVATLVFDKVYPIGQADEYGTHPIAWIVPFLVCIAGSAVALGVVGLRLRAERSVDLGDIAGAPPARTA